MTIFGLVGWIVAVLAIAYCLRLYYELWKWARLCQDARIHVAYKKRVKLQGPLTEWITWTRMLDDDKASQGRVVYQMGGTAIAITRADAKVNVRFREFVRVKLATRRQAKQPQQQRGMQHKVGTWSATDDKTGAKGGTAT